MATRIRLRRDTATNWTSSNPTLSLGEPGYDTTNNKLKIGDGTSTWSQLSYLTDNTGLNTGQLSGLQLTGKIPTKIDLLSEDSEVWIRTNNNENIVAVIAPGITLKRKNSGGAIYNAYNNVETSSDNNVSPLGTLWNADGWGDLADVQTRTYTTFYQACNGNVGQNVVGREFVMHDTINDQYFKVEFTFWQPAQGGGAGQSVNFRGGLTMVYTPITLTSVTYFVRGENDTNLGDSVGPGLTIKRGSAGALYNSEEEAEWDPDNTPAGTLWNAEHEWRDFSDITALTWKPLYSALHGYLGNKIVGAKLLMWDTINDKYYTVKFTDWGVNNGGSFAYVRREIFPSTGNRTGIVFADGSFQDTATTLGDLHVADGNAIENSVQPGYGAEIRYDVKNNWQFDNNNHWTGTANWVTSGNQGFCQFVNNDVNNPGQVYFRNFLGDLGRWYIKTVRINGGEPQTVTGWGYDYFYTAVPPATDPTEVTELRFDVVFRSRFYMGGENTVGFFLNDRDENFEVQSQDFNVYAHDDVRIRGRDFVEIRNSATDGGVSIVADGDNTNKTWEFMPDGSIQLPNLNSTGWNWNYNLNGPTLKLGNNQSQNIITGANTTQNYPNAQRIIIQGQRGYGTWGQNTAGEGGDVYIWGGVGGERSLNGAVGSDLVATNQDFNIGQTGGVYLVWTVLASNYTTISNLFIEDGWNGTSTNFTYSHPEYFTLTSADVFDPSTPRAVAQLGINNFGDMYFFVTAVPGDPSVLPNGSEATVGYNVSGIYGGGSGGDIKIRGGQGQNNEGGYVRIEGGQAVGWNTDPTGGFVEINGGDAVDSGNGNGGDVRIRGGKKHGTGNNGEVYIRTGANEEFEWKFDNGGTLTLPSSSTIKEVAAPIVGNAILLTPSGGNETTQALKIYPTEIGEGDHVHLTANGGNTELYLGDDNHYVKLVNGGNVEIRSDDMAGNSAVWTFGTDATTTLPGAVVNSTVAKTANVGIPLTLGDSTWGVALGDGSYGPFMGSIVGIVYTVVVTGGAAAYTIVSYPGDIAVDTVIDQLDAGSLGGTPGNTSNISVTAVNDDVALDLNKSINKLADGNYTLANGVEGQIMYLVPQSGITPSNVFVDVGNYRVGGFNGANGGLYPFRIFNDADSSYYDSRGFCTLIFTDGAWEQNGGSWD